MIGVSQERLSESSAPYRQIFMRYVWELEQEHIYPFCTEE